MLQVDVTLLNCGAVQSVVQAGTLQVRQGRTTESRPDAPASRAAVMKLFVNRSPGKSVKLSHCDVLLAHDRILLTLE